MLRITGLLRGNNRRGASLSSRVSQRCATRAPRSSFSSTSASTLEVTRKGEYVILSLNRPKVNAINDKVLEELTDAVKSAESESKIRGLLLTSSLSGTFSAGLDIPQLLQQDRTQMENWWNLFNNTLIALSSSRLVTMAALNGHSPAGGTVLALTTDYRIMAEGNYKIGLNEVAVNIIMPEGIIALARNAMGLRNAELCGLTGRLLDPQKAQAVGLVDEVVPKEDLLPYAEKKMSEWLRSVTRAVEPTRQNFKQDIVAALKRQKTAYVNTFLDFWFHPQTQAGFKAFSENLKKK